MAERRAGNLDLRKGEGDLPMVLKSDATCEERMQRI
jgi:hypothetical protein